MGNKSFSAIGKLTAEDKEQGEDRAVAGASLGNWLMLGCCQW